MKVYICGPMTGLPDYNRPAFYQVEEALRTLGMTDVVNPARVGEHDDWDWADYLRVGIGCLVGCDAIAVMRGADNSAGAKLEMRIADELRLVAMSAPRLLAAAERRRALADRSLSSLAKDVPQGPAS